MNLRCARLVLFFVLFPLVACSGDPTAEVPPDEVTPDAGALLPDDAESATPFDATSREDVGVPPLDGGADATPDAVAETDIDQIPWESGANVGFGVARKDTGNPRGTNVFIAYAGYKVDLAGAKAWATALYRATLKARGVRYVWAVQGPNTPSYDNTELGNTKLASTLLPLVTTSTKFILVAGHSSGSFVAHELLRQLATGADPQGVSASRVVYFDLDGGKTGLTTASVARLRKAYFVGARDPALPGTSSLNYKSMTELATQYGSGGFYPLQASGSGCNAGATVCLHLTCITTTPHDPSGNGPGEVDYTTYAGRSVSHAYIEDKASEAMLVP